MGFRMDSSNLIKNLSIMESRVDKAIKVKAEVAAAKLQTQAREEAPWTDRTGDARKRMISYVSQEKKGYRINLAGGVEYALWLELANEGKYAIIEPTIRLKSPEIIKDFNNFMELIGASLSYSSGTGFGG